MLKIGVIGAGAAGYFAAINAATKNTSVTIFEKTSKSLAKVKVSGGGRCNVTHAAFEIAKLVKNYPRGEKFLKKTFKHFAVGDTVNWFESRGVKLKREADGRMFPVSDDSESIIQALVNEANQNGVYVRYNFSIDKIEYSNNQFTVYSKENREIFDRLIICIGGSPKLTGFKFIHDLGHKVSDPIPSLFTFNTPYESIRELMGISLPDSHIKLEGTKLAYQGPLLITHWGLSGPAVLKLSAFGAPWLYDQKYNAKAHIRWNTLWTEHDLQINIGKYKSEHPKKKIKSNPLFGLPGRLWEHLVEKSEIDPLLLWHEISKKNLNKLIQNLFCYIVSIEGKTTFKEEFVTAGGVKLEEVNPETMESNLFPGLFFAGEVLDIDGITGGFNFQAAWSTGYLAGINSIKTKSDV
ncbi:NAD(P)/FAD-dependent oxidoreductase [Belliella sp. DSM 107340]|uniref:NAD(P)/FAD-dependent oxidoreductase n=1 Tax=Belliella calami TaxID=2923436 RepID=A0ABS9URW0_9BACT|nr:NAD(P)/FAD-dependent oxidoreductase [Belliella calami]MCH7399229.1 NAD(P)/FAD-dependent oxidoreductase [Belliella calami]